jgi:chromosome segregation protein
VRYLKQLVVQGYKTFASRTEFVFDAGVTAIVGPNGSGKSNVADALRWVLGEQSYGTLRGKRTEDMIFSGSEQRARMGMAFVSLILDNSTGWLPIDFAEVEIARRAYRSGENEYYLNGNKVRLRDVSELLGSSGLAERTYTSIGQGLVDQALSQRPEERRKLFEEAAGITVYQSKRDQAASRLADTQTNLTRARDIISELTPRLRYLKGQARRAQEYQQLKRDLETHLHTWYGYRWRQALLSLAGARNRATDAARAAEEEAAELNGLLEAVTALRGERIGLRDELTEWHRASSGLHREAESVQRELAVRAEQVRLWREQGDDLSRELGYLRAALEDGAQRLESAQAELREAREGHGLQAARVGEAQRELEARERERQTRTRSLAQAQDLALALKTQLAEQRSRLAQVGDRRGELARSDAEQQTAAETAAKELALLETQLRGATAKLDEGARLLAALETERQTHGATLNAAQEAERKAAEQLAQAQRAAGRLQDQLDMLERLRDEGAGLSSGVRAVMAAARASDRNSPPDRSPQKPGAQRQPLERLNGVLGTLGDLIEVPPELDRALEAALGGRVQDVVVRRWEDAEAAVDFLKRSQSGRATFLPLDTLRPGRLAEAPRAPGVIGVASELVRFDATIRPAVELALNHTIVVKDLPTARGLLARAGGVTLVTLDGEIVRSSGSVTGGAENRARDGGLLTRARTLRELPGQIREAQTAVAEHEKRVTETQRNQREARAALDALRVRRDELSGTQNRLNAELNKLQLATERLRQTRGWHEERRKNLANETTTLNRSERELEAAIEATARQLAEREAQVETLRREVNALAADDLVGELARARAEAAVSTGRLRSLESRVRELTDAQATRSREITSKEDRQRSLALQQAEAAEAIEVKSRIARKLASEIAALAAKIDPAEARLAELEKQQRQSEAHEKQLRDQVRYAQSRQNQADLAAQRGQDELAHLRGRDREGLRAGRADEPRRRASSG